MSLFEDRYFVIMHPLKVLSTRTKSKAILINVSIWICKKSKYFLINQN